MPVPLSHGRAINVTCLCSLLGREYRVPARLRFLKHEGEQAVGTVLLLAAFTQYTLRTAPPQCVETTASFTSSITQHHMVIS